MSIVGINVEYSNICKDYNTVYLDRDNDDPQTKKCMKSVTTWFEALLHEAIEEFAYTLHRVTNDTPVKLAEIVSNRFLFYSLEKEITLQSFLLHNEGGFYKSLNQWQDESKESLLLQNDEEGEGISFFVKEGSQIETWLREKLNDFDLDEAILRI